MPKNNVADPITDQEIAFARLVLSGTMTDRRGAEAVGLNPDTAAYTKAKPRVRAYMLEHRAAVQQRLVEQETEQVRRVQLGRDQILGRLWEIANLSPEMTRGSITGQVKALSMIIAIEGLVPDRISDRRAVSGQNKPAPPPVPPEIYAGAWRRPQQAETLDPEPPTPVPAQQEGGPEPQPATGREANEAHDPPPTPIPDSALDPSDSAFADRFHPSKTTFASPPDTRVPFSIPKRFSARRR